MRNTESEGITKFVVDTDRVDELIWWTISLRNSKDFDEVILSISINQHQPASVCLSVWHKLPKKGSDVLGSFKPWEAGIPGNGWEREFPLTPDSRGVGLVGCPVAAALRPSLTSPDPTPGLTNQPWWESTVQICWWLDLLFWQSLQRCSLCHLSLMCHSLLEL